MPIEIRELVIQARVRDDEPVNSNAMIQRVHDAEEGHGITLNQLDPAVIDQIAKVCLEQMKEWIAAQRLR